MADPVLKFPPEQKGEPPLKPRTRIGAEPRRRLMAAGELLRAVAFLAIVALAAAGKLDLLGLALLEGFSLEETLLAFAEHYRQVLADPEGSDHGNIRALLAHGLACVQMSQPSITAKT